MGDIRSKHKRGDKKILSGAPFQREGVLQPSCTTFLTGFHHELEHAGSHNLDL